LFKKVVYKIVTHPDEEFISVNF